MRSRNSGRSLGGSSSKSTGRCGLTRCGVCSCDRGGEVSGARMDRRATVESSLKATDWEGDKAGLIPGGQSLQFMPCLRQKVSARSGSPGKTPECHGKTWRKDTGQRMDRKATVESVMKQTRSRSRSRSIGRAQTLLFMPSLREKVRQRSKSTGRNNSYCEVHSSSGRGSDDLECESDPCWHIQDGQDDDEDRMCDTEACNDHDGQTEADLKPFKVEVKACGCPSSLKLEGLNISISVSKE